MSIEFTQPTLYKFIFIEQPGSVPVKRYLKYSFGTLTPEAEHLLSSNIRHGFSCLLVAFEQDWLRLCKVWDIS